MMSFSQFVVIIWGVESSYPNDDSVITDDDSVIKMMTRRFSPKPMIYNRF